MKFHKKFTPFMVSTDIITTKYRYMYNSREVYYIHGVQVLITRRAVSTRFCLESKYFVPQGRFDQPLHVA